jgi:hypothetical protein
MIVGENTHMYTQQQQKKKRETAITNMLCFVNWPCYKIKEMVKELYA